VWYVTVLLDVSKLDGRHWKFEVALVDEASVYPLQHPPSGGESHVYMLKSEVCVEQAGCSIAQNAGGEGPPPGIGRAQVHGDDGDDGGASGVQKVGGGDAPSMGMVQVHADGGDAGGSGSRSSRLSQLAGEYGVGGGLKGGGDDGGGVEGGGGEGGGGEAGGGDDGGGGVDGGGIGHSPGSIEFTKPPNMKLRPVVQHSVIAYRMRNVLTLSNSTLIDRLACSSSSVNVLTGLSFPMPYRDPFVIKLGHE